MTRNGKEQRPTVLDVAREAGVSVATVSRVMSNIPTVSEANRVKVMEAVARMSFRPNTMARNLRKGRSRTVALVVSDIEQNFFASVAKNIQQQLEEEGLDLLLYNTNHSPHRLQGFLDRVPSMGLTGVVIATTDQVQMDAVLPLLNDIREAGVGILSIIQRLEGTNFPAIVHEEREACARSVNYLLNTGRGPVAFIGRITGSAVGAERYEGYRAALAAHGERLRPELVWNASYRYLAGYEATAAAIDRGLDFRSIQTASDELAYGAMAALRDRGRSIPGDVAVIGFGNLDMSAHMRPALTSVGSDNVQLAQRVAAFFRGGREGDEPHWPPLKRDLVIRDSA